MEKFRTVMDWVVRIAMAISIVGTAGQQLASTLDVSNKDSK